MRTIKYADNQVLIVNNDEELHIMMAGLVEVGKTYGLEINMEKSKVFRITRKSKKLNIRIKGITLRQV